MCDFALINWMNANPNAIYRCDRCGVESKYNDKISTMPASGGPLFVCLVCNPEKDWAKIKENWMFFVGPRDYYYNR